MGNIVKTIAIGIVVGLVFLNQAYSEGKSDGIVPSQCVLCILHRCGPAGLFMHAMHIHDHQLLDDRPNVWICEIHRYPRYILSICYDRSSAWFFNRRRIRRYTNWSGCCNRCCLILNVVGWFLCTKCSHLVIMGWLFKSLQVCK